MRRRWRSSPPRSCSASCSDLARLTVTGDESAIAAVVAVNIGAIAADEARSTIVVDTDARTCPVAAALHIHAEPGIADILDKRAAWAEVVTPAVIGRSRVIDVIPS